MLEAQLHADNSFVTLTYDDDHLPEGGNLVPRHLQNFLKRLRKRMEPDRIRFFGVGEYGDKTERPHYHVILFGMPSCRNGMTRVGKAKCCYVCDLVKSVWPYGHVYVGSVEDQSAQYVSGYTVKKWTMTSVPELKGRLPEFSRMSNRPGIGANAMTDVASVLMMSNYQKPDVPKQLRHGRRLSPLGTYLVKKLRIAMGRRPEAPKETIDEQKEKLRPVREVAFARSQNLKEAIREDNQGSFNRLEWKHRNRKRKVL